MSITRRDFLNGVLLSTAAAPLTQLGVLSASGTVSAGELVDYPPLKTGMRGSQPGSYDAAHSVAWAGKKNFGTLTQLKEEYDLVIVGAGISGLSAAYYYQKQLGNKARILLLDNHDDFGGHARRNEFTINGQMRLGYGGTQSIENPGSYSKVAKLLLKELGIESSFFEKAYKKDYFKKNNLQGMTYFNKSVYGKDTLVPFVFKELAEFMTGIKGNAIDAKQAIKQMPLSELARQQLLRLATGKPSKLLEMPIKKQAKYLHNTSYYQFVQDEYGVTDPLVLRLLRYMIADDWAMGTDTLSVYEAVDSGCPGLDADQMYEILEAAGEDLGDDEEEDYIYHFPDGNASIARALVRRLIPDVANGKTMEDLVTARFHYDRLDKPNSLVRLRLNSTVYNVKRETHGVTVSYVNNNKAFAVKSKHCVMACYNMMIPHLVPQLPKAQKEALSELVKMPLIYTTVLLKNWQAVQKQGLAVAYCPGNFHTIVQVDYPVDIGDYQHSATPDMPMSLTMIAVPMGKVGVALKEQFRAGRRKLLSITYAQFEQEIKEHLNGMLGPAGFNADRDIEAITINRWGHGYSYYYSDLNESDDFEENGPHIKGRKPFGPITIANADSGGDAYTDIAIDQAHRAVSELFTK
ncbi:FAD-dependent oxidoreductase [Endozoicomonas sp. SM1973]|uniref:FAD-dependent oxidoreductase n=1 Tax=Spartinivicinus marinus TaxID=2994442 RepID=A0A853IJS5_9GAMM|nr:FAD-dependent oxidoreductase [Spartinivicinus marinus]MCX4027582.1 FAD-dependent oxidoreductase [Spartinivicinus marinus]NYZ69335.1 FAD-dependent oxidoreductase [Spartinivicinus marinus]